MHKQQVVVIGSGVIGLTTANKIQSTGKFNVTIVAEHTPGPLLSGDMQSTDWASPWAGAHWRAWSSNEDTALQQIEIQTYNEMMSLAVSEPQSGISKARGTDIFEVASGMTPWYITLVEDARELSAAELPEGISYGLEYTTLLIDVPKYLVYLKTKFEAGGGTIVQRCIDHIADALRVVSNNQSGQPVNTTIVVNCTGLGSRNLAGVKDSNMHPIRGQTVVVYAPAIKHTITRLGKQFSYVIPRGDGTVVLGGTAEDGDWNAQPVPSTTDLILQRAIFLEPALLPESSTYWNTAADSKRIADLKGCIISENVGFRPMREGGVRLETQTCADPVFGSDFTVVHCYGHSGYGYQTSIAFAQRVCQIVEDVAN
ncbi:hypothetical protein LPJ66_002077 [Kickxella alabastrina]|uniref:Uncharacterized protein n=1 Tax=Kickxella alabastrina TaxID=61397 RepID=A0ACC1IRF1_9FUNG|nr:hypothetical protein LPJ66_002077 [Kickxella alabastrina]